MDKRNIIFEQIYLTWFSRMKSFAKEYVISNPEAENIVQDVFLELWEKKELLAGHTNLVAFLFTAIRNRCLNYLRHAVVKRDAETFIQEEQALTLRMNLNSLLALDDNIFSEQNLEQVVTRAIDSLPPKCRQIFILNKLEGKKQKEIAEYLGVSVNTVENQMAIAYKKLRSELKDYLPLFLFIFSI